MTYVLVPTSSFKKDLKLIARRRYDLSKLHAVLKLLQTSGQIPEQYHDHQLSGNLKDFRELHITPDWLLIYTRNQDTLIISLSRTGSHSDLFKK